MPPYPVRGSGRRRPRGVVGREPLPGLRGRQRPGLPEHVHDPRALRLQRLELLQPDRAPGPPHRPLPDAAPAAAARPRSRSRARGQPALLGGDARPPRPARSSSPAPARPPTATTSTSTATPRSAPATTPEVAWRSAHFDLDDYRFTRAAGAGSPPRGQQDEGWDLRTLAAEPHEPRILSTADDARAILLRLPDGEELQEHEVHENARILTRHRSASRSPVGEQRSTAAGSSPRPTPAAGQWQAAQLGGSLDLRGVSCGTPSLCVAVARGGRIFVSTDPTGGASAWRDAGSPTGPRDLEGVSCVVDRCSAPPATCRRQHPHLDRSCRRRRHLERGERRRLGAAHRRLLPHGDDAVSPSPTTATSSPRPIRPAAPASWHHREPRGSFSCSPRGPATAIPGR